MQAPAILDRVRRSNDADIPMTPRFGFGAGGIHLPTAFLSYALGTAGGLLADLLGLPLPMLLGSLLAVGAASLAGLRPLGHLPQVPQRWRQLFIPVIGVSIGGAFRPEILQEARQWWPSLLALCVYVPLVHFIGYRALRATGRVDPMTAFFGTAPGGLIEAVEIGEQMGAEPRMLTMLQFLRLILTIILVPLAFTWMTGHSVGSGGGAVMTGADLALGLRDVAIMLAAGAVGAWVGVRMRMPAGWITGPILLSGLAHLTGVIETVPPLWLLTVTQVVIGTSLGVRFAGMPLGQVWLAMRLSGLYVALTMAVAGAVAFAMAGIVDESVSAVFLAFAPGGLAEMALIAISLQISVVYVSAHHVLRIVLAITIARAFAGRVRR